MKKWISVLLVLVLLLSLCACGKKAALTDLLECPTDSLEDAEAFLKDAGLEIKSSTAQYVTFTFGNWDGQVSARGVSLNISEIAYGKSDVDYDKEVKEMLEQVEELCGEPYATNDNSPARPSISTTVVRSWSTRAPSPEAARRELSSIPAQMPNNLP